MLKIVARGKDDERYIILASSKGMIADDSWGDIKFTLTAPGISNETIHLGFLSDESNVEGLIKFLELLEIHVNEANCEEIVEVFDGMQPFKTIIEDASGGDTPYPAADFLERLQTYGEAITSPSFSVEGGIRRVTLWTVESWTGKLERWVISEDNEGKRQIESEEM
jgi:hypothetical protein